jgi:hypothetical protein
MYLSIQTQATTLFPFKTEDAAQAICAASFCVQKYPQSRKE